MEVVDLRFGCGMAWVRMAKVHGGASGDASNVVEALFVGVLSNSETF